MRWGWLAVLLLAAGAALADAGAWVGEDGRALPDTPARKTSDGFGGWLLVTADPEWRVHWNRPPKGRPSLSEARYVGYGERLTILAFYTNPATTPDGRIDIRCSVRVIRPDDTVATEASDSQCASPEPRGDLQAARISWAVIDYVGEKGDPPGQWVVEMKLTDAVRGVSLALETDFILTSGSVMTSPRLVDAQMDGYPTASPPQFGRRGSASREGSDDRTLARVSIAGTGCRRCGRERRSAAARPAPGVAGPASR